MITTSMITAAGSESVGGSLFILIIGVLGLVLAITWLIFPFLVLSRFDELLKIDREIMKDQREIRAALLSANTAQSEIAKAIQWMVNNWKQEGSKPPDQPPPVSGGRTSYSTYDDAGNVIQTHEDKGDFNEP
jgi:hypothetical protein